MKIVSLVVSCFTGSYIRFWLDYFQERPLLSTPTFDGRAICYPSDKNIRDYLSWRQADTHVNNLVGITMDPLQVWWYRAFASDAHLLGWVNPSNDRCALNFHGRHDWSWQIIEPVVLFCKPGVCACKPFHVAYCLKDDCRKSWVCAWIHDQQRHLNLNNIPTCFNCTFWSEFMYYGKKPNLVDLKDNDVLALLEMLISAFWAPKAAVCVL